MEHRHRFLSACGKGDLCYIQDLLEKELVHINCADDDESTALQVAAANGHDAVVQFLLSRGALVDKANKYGWTPLMLAARYGHTAIVTCLLKNRACVNVRNKLGASGLVCATRSGHLSAVKALLENGADVSSPTTEELTAVMVAAQYGYDSILKLLIINGCDINHRAPSNGLTALMVAASNGHKSTAQILVEHGSCINTTNVCGETALDIAILRGKRQIRCYLDQAIASMRHLESDARDCDFLSAIQLGNLEKVKWMISQTGTEINSVRKEDGATPLMLAAMMGHLSIVKLLVEKGARMDQQDTIHGWTALMQAVFHRNNEVAHYLIRAGADVNLQLNNGCTAFDLATLLEKSDSELIRVLSQLTTFTSKFVGHSCVFNTNGEVKEGEKWWGRVFRRLRHRKVKKESDVATATKQVKPLDAWKRCSPSTPNLPHKPSPVVLSTPAILNESGPSSAIEESKSPLLLLGSASPCRSAASSNALKQVVPPLLPSSGLDTSNPGRSTMPMGRKFEVLNPFQKLTSSSGLQCRANPSAEVEGSSAFREVSGGASRDSKSDDLYDILKKWSLEHYYPLFEEQEVDREAMALLNESDLKEMGIDSTVSREHLMRIILQLKAETCSN